MAVPVIFPKNKGSSKNRTYYQAGVKHDHKVEKITLITSNCLARINFEDFKNGNSESADALYHEIDTATKCRELELGTRREVKPVFHMSVSLAPGESLTDDQWAIAAKYLMKGLGFDLQTNKYFVVKHTDKEHEHIHITANRIKLESGYPIVSDANEREVSCRLTGEIEDMFGLSKATQPHQTDDANISPDKKSGGKRPGGDPNKYRMLGIVAGTAEYISSKNGDMIDFVKALRRKDVYIHLTYGADGQPRGIQYELGGTVIAGKQLKAARFTFSKLTTQEGIRYDKSTLPQLQMEMSKRREGYQARLTRDGKRDFRAIRGYYYIKVIPESPRFNFFKIKVKKTTSATFGSTLTHAEVMKIVEAILLLFKVLFGVTCSIKEGREGNGYIRYFADEPAMNVVSKAVPWIPRETLEKMLESIKDGRGEATAEVVIDSAVVSAEDAKEAAIEENSKTKDADPKLTA